MTDRLRIALAQLNPTIGALKLNREKAEAAVARAHADDVDILMFPELCLTGYFPDDLLKKPQFIDDAIAAVHQLARTVTATDLDLLVPTPWLESGRLYNAVAHVANGEVQAVRFKHELPEYDVFYEKRYFVPGPLPEPFAIKGVRIGVPICEDIWWPPVCTALKNAGAEMLLCPNGSPYWRNRHHIRRDLLSARIDETGLPVLYLNQVGGQDELVFDGASFGMNREKTIVFEGESFKEDFIVSDWIKEKNQWTCAQGTFVGLVSVDEAPWRACVLGLRDYLHKNGFSNVVLGLSGGIDSAIVAALAVDAVGADNVHCVMMPYRYTSEASLADAKACAHRLGVRYDVVPIDGPVDSALESLRPVFGDRPEDITEENIQSRMRGTILMAISNKLGSLLLTTGNKSELAVGYATIYGDMNGGFNPIKDMTKTQVYRLAAWRNAHLPGDCLGPDGEVIPDNIITKAPSAELRPDQTDQDSLPEYEVLDAILEAMVEREMSVAEIEAEGHDRATIKKVEGLLNLAEYKRRQAAPGVKLTPKAFGAGRRYPITNRYRDESGA